MSRAQGANAKMALAFETVYGTPPASGYIQMPMVSNSLADEQPLLDSDVLGFGRDPLDPLQDAITADGDIVIPIDLENIGVWLKATFGQPVTTGAGPYVHTYHSNSWVIPSIAIEKQMPDLPLFEMFPGIRVDDFSWEMRRGGLLTASVKLIAQGKTKAATTQAGTLAQKVYKRFGQFNGSIEIDGNAVGDLTMFRASYKNNLDRIDGIRDDGLISGLDPSIATMTGSMDVRLGDEVLLDIALNHTPVDIVVSHTLSATEKLVWTIHRVFLPKPRNAIEGPKGVQVTFDWQAAQDLTQTPARMLTAVLTNSVVSF